MSRSGFVLGWVLLGLLWSPAWGQDKGPEQPQTAARAMDVYDDTDPQAPLKRAIEEMMGVYLVHPPRRHAAERVIIKGKRATVDVWHPVGIRSDTWLKARAVEWLLMGRTQFAQGARGIFSKIDAINEVRLRFIEVVRPQVKGRRLSKKKERIKPYLVLSLKRKNIAKIDMAKMERCIGRRNCNRAFGRSFSIGKMDAKYTAKRRKDS